MARPRQKQEELPPLRSPAKTIEGREQQMVNAAIDLAEKQIREGTASSQVITHYLKLGTTSYQLEHEKLQNENRLLEAKVEAMKSAQRMEELYANAIKAMATYSGKQSEEEVLDEDL